jgi:hypothetical protein
VTSGNPLGSVPIALTTSGLIPCLLEGLDDVGFILAE